MAVIDAIENITNALEGKKKVIGIFIDLKKAFDTINHSILLKKLERYGIRGIAGNWIKSYLMERPQFIKMGDNNSKCMYIVCGLPQGSILSPLLFNLYINDIFKVSNIVKMVLFADDTNIFYANDNHNDLVKTVNQELEKLKTWLDINKLSLNLGKTKAIMFGNYQEKHEQPITIANTIIEKVQEIKFLGIHIDSKLSWKPHIRETKKRISKNIAIINKAKEVLNIKALHILYSSLILSTLTYGIEIWGSNYKSVLYPLCILQKRAIRVINKVSYLEHTNEFFIKNKMLKLMDLSELYMAQFMYKVSKKLLPLNLQNMFTERESSYKLRGCSKLKIPAVRTTRKSMFISVGGARLWNNMNSELKQCSSISQFKSKYKKKLLINYIDT